MKKNKNCSSAKSSAGNTAIRWGRGLLLSDQDRILGGGPTPGPTPTLPTIEDIQKALSDRPALLKEFDEMKKSNDKNVWDAFLVKMVEWTKEGGHNHKRVEILAAMFWHFGSKFYDYSHYWKGSNSDKNKEQK